MNSAYCLYCSSEHPLVYLVAVGGKHKHLVYKCPKKGTKFLPMVHGLKIPVIQSKKAIKQEQDSKQQSLL